LPEGPFLAVGSHGGATLILDTLVFLAAHHTSGRTTPLLTLAHDQMFEAYPEKLARAVAKMGAIRADPALAREALRRGFGVLAYPGGDYDACRSFFRRNEIVFAGRTGYVDLAREANVPIVPVVSHGAHSALCVLWDGAPIARALRLHARARLTVFPISLALPWGLFFGPLPGYLPLPTKISIRVLAPLSVRPEATTEAVDREVRARMQAELDHLARRSVAGNGMSPQGAP
jgi:1-acyl-sn-glycerol-3-phosphate acyltransferase